MDKFNYLLFATQVGPRETSVLAAFLRGHLWVEARLNEVLETILVDPDAIDLSRESFARKVALSRATGGISPAFAQAILAMNRVRNRLAHDLDAEVLDSDVDAMWAPLVMQVPAHRFATRQTEDMATRMFQWFLNVVWTMYLEQASRDWDAQYATSIQASRWAHSLENAARRTSGEADTEFEWPAEVPKRPTMADVAVLPDDIT